MLRNARRAVMDRVTARHSSPCRSYRVPIAGPPRQVLVDTSTLTVMVFDFASVNITPRIGETSV